MGFTKAYQSNNPLCPHCHHPVSQHEPVSYPLNGPRDWHRRCWSMHSNEWYMHNGEWVRIQHSRKNG